MRYVSIVIRRDSGVVASTTVRQGEFTHRSDFEAVAVGSLLASVFSPVEPMDGMASIALRDDESDEIRRGDIKVWYLVGNIEECPGLDRLADAAVEWMGWVNDPYVPA